MFKNNKYTKWYFQIIDSGHSDKPINGYYEKHHIVPISLNGARKKNNEVYLSYRQHFLCHLLLMKMCENPKHHKSMCFAFITMARGPYRDRESINSHTFERFRRVAAKSFSGENNPAFGKGYKWVGDKNPMSKPENRIKHLASVRTPEHRQKMSEVMFSDKNPMNKPETRIKHLASLRTPEYRKKLSKSIIVDFLDGSSKEFIGKCDLGPHLGMSTYLGYKLCYEKNHLLGKYGIKSINENIKD